MKYMGGKGRYAKELLPIILKDRRADQCYVEPFVGGCGMMDKVDGWRLGCDINPYLIALWKAVQKGWDPPDNITEDEYNEIRLNKDRFPAELVGFCGFSYSFGAKWFGGFARGYKPDGTRRHYGQEDKRALLKQRPLILSVEFYCSDYRDLAMPKNSVIYCDPPYAGTTKYKDSFDNNIFWDWVRDKSKFNKVFVSEYNAPPDFECLWSKKVNNSLDKNTGSKQGVEKLFILKGV